MKGTFWPGPVIGKIATEQICAVAEAGHEIGLHAWDHHQWQSRVGTMSQDTIRKTNDKAMDLLEKVVSRRARCMAAPSWRISSEAIVDREQRDLRYCSDCRGNSMFYPIIGDRVCEVVQIPTTLPTYDELIGQEDITCSNYNDHLLSLFHQKQLNVLTIHAEVEGGACLNLFKDFLQKATNSYIVFINLEKLLQIHSRAVVSPIIQKKITGREGQVSYQGEKGEY